MCVTFFYWDSLPHHLLLVVFNRDEHLHRPTEPAHLWDVPTGVLGGRDKLGGGTWLAASTAGKAAWVTTFREEYAGVNLVAVDLVRRSCAYLSNGNGTRVFANVRPGLHAMANGFMDAPDHAKVGEGVRQLRAMQVAGAFDGPDVPWDQIFEMMSDTRVLETEPARLPATGFGAAFESEVSRMFIPPMLFSPTSSQPAMWYGTRCQTILAVGRDGRAEWRERSLRWSGEPGSSEWKEVVLSTHICV